MRERVALTFNIMHDLIGSQRWLAPGKRNPWQWEKTAARVAKRFVACEVEILGFLVSAGTWSYSASGG